MKVSQECLREKDFININRPNRSFFVFFNNKKTNRVNVSIDSNGGSPIDNIMISDNNELTLPAIPTKEDYTFTGYEFDGDKIASNGMTVSKDVVLKAMWIDNDADFVTVTFVVVRENLPKLNLQREVLYNYQNYL